jgi:hypothetical protein
LVVEPGQRHVLWRDEEEGYRDQADEDAQNARGNGLDALGGFGVEGSDPPVEKKISQTTGKKAV